MSSPFTIATVKKFNVQQHFTLNKDNKYPKLENESRKKALQKLKDGKRKRTQFFHSVLHQGNSATEANFKVSSALKKDRLFSDAELVKKCILK